MADLSPLRGRMIWDVTVRNLWPATQRSYEHAVAKFSRYLGSPPERLGLEGVRSLHVHLVATHLVASSELDGPHSAVSSRGRHARS